MKRTVQIVQKERDQALAKYGEADLQVHEWLAIKEEAKKKAQALQTELMQKKSEMPQGK